MIQLNTKYYNHFLFKLQFVIKYCICRVVNNRFNGFMTFRKYVISMTLYSVCVKHGCIFVTEMLSKFFKSTFLSDNTAIILPYLTKYKLKKKTFYTEMMVIFLVILRSK